jgi:chlorobactene glucosyltransferase
MMTALVAVLPLVACTMTLLNAVSWRRGRTGASFSGRVSLLIPARNEAMRLPAALRAVAASHSPPHEVIVYDDGSTDATPAVLAELAREMPTLRVIRGGDLPAGWVGKPHACERLAGAATGEVLVFVDADVVLSPTGLERLASIHADGASVVTAVPLQITRSPFEQLVVPFLLLSYLSWLPLELVARSRDERVVAANGQVLSVTRDALQKLGGFAAVRTEIVDDVALVRQAKRTGLPVAFVDGSQIASCRMYDSAGAVWRGFSKNIHEGVGSSQALAGVVALYFATFVLPWLLLGLSAVWPALLLPAAVAVSANVLQRVVLSLRWRQSLLGVAHQAIGALCVIAIALNSLRWSLRGEIHWAGRRYRSRAARRGLA